MIELIVKDMMCEGCAATISRAVAAVDPTGRAEVDVAGRWVRIASHRHAAHFAAAIDDAGFSPAIWWDGSPAPN